MHKRELLRSLADLARDPRHPVPSPCVSVCRIDERDGLCLGCRRSMPEIMAWPGLDEPGRRAVWQRVVQRAGLDARPGRAGVACEGGA